MTQTGFTGGTVPNPTYEQVCEERTGHAETVAVIYDRRLLSTATLLRIFFELHDFTKDRRSDSDGQYRSAIFLDANPESATEQAGVARCMIQRLTQNGYVLATEILPNHPFYPAGNRHQQYCSVKGITPKRRDSATISEILTF